MHHEGPIHRMKSTVNNAVSSGNSVAVQVLLRLFSLTGARLYNERAKQTLSVCQDAMEQNAYGTSAMLCTLDLYFSKPKEVVILGIRRNPVTESFTAAVNRQYVTNKILFLLDESRRSQERALRWRQAR